MAAQKSIAKGTGAPSAAPKGKAAVRRRPARKSHSSTPTPARKGRARPTRQEPDPVPKPSELLETLSARLALVETASIALRKFEEEPEIGSICASLEHAALMLGRAHADVELCLRKRTR